MTTAAVSQMPVVIIPGPHIPKKHPTIPSVKTPNELLKQSCPELYQEGSTRIVASSFDNQDFQQGEVYASSSSFVRSAIEAWGRHSHLVLRPDDIWFTILVQMNFYMQKHAEEVRHIFVSHEGKQELVVEDVTWPLVVEGFRQEVQSRIKTPWMSDWISPGFSTSTIDDERTATILMMGLMKNFFDYTGGIICGIPSVTLLGTLQDWERLLQKVDRLDLFGPGPKEYARRLRPILIRIISSFTDPSSAQAKDFWNEVVQAKVKHSNLCGHPPTEYIISGWIVGFFYWDHTGQVRRTHPFWIESMSPVTYDGIEYGATPLGEIPVGYAKADFKMLNAHGGDFRKPFHGWVLAGSIGKRITDGAPEGYTSPTLRKEEATVSQPGEVSNVQAIGVSPTEAGDDSPTYTADPTEDPFEIWTRFSRMQSAEDLAAETGETQDHTEKQWFAPRSDKHSRQDGSIIQPMSGWFLFGPADKVGPLQDEELDGVTVDAIDSCENTEHFEERY